MDYSKTIKMAVSSLLSNKIRSFLTSLGIIIGVSSVVLIISIGAGAQSLISNSIKDIGTNIINILPGAKSDSGPPASAMGVSITTLKNGDAEALKSIPHVDLVVSYSRGNAEFAYQNRSVSSNFSGVDQDFLEIENHSLELGKFFTERDNAGSAKVAVLGADLKTDLFPGSNPVGEFIKINNVSFKVLGVLEKKGSDFVNNPDNQAYIPLNTAQKILLGIDYLGSIRVKVDSEQNVDFVKESIEKTIRRRHQITDPNSDDFSVTSLSQALDVFETVTSSLSFFLGAVAAISLLVGGIGITNIMLMTVKERTREIGLRKAIGASPTQIKSQFIIEALVLTITGGVIGILVGILISFLISLIANYLEYNWTFIVSTFSIIISLGFAVFIGVIFGSYPARKAAELNPIDALRYE